MADQYYYSTGKRKTSVARVWLYPNGSGKVTINKMPAKEYFTVSTQLGTILEPLRTVEKQGQFDIRVVVQGGGVSGQAEAIRHGIAKGLVILDETLRSPLKRKGFLTRDPRSVERKKPGLKKARRSPQWAKR